MPISTTRIRWYALVQFIAHLGVLALGGVALWRLSGTWWSAALAVVVFAVCYTTMWARWLAAGSRSRLGFRGRLLVVLVSGALVVTIAGLTGMLPTAVIAVSMIILCDALDRNGSGGAADGLE